MRRSGGRTGHHRRPRAVAGVGSLCILLAHACARFGYGLLGGTDVVSVDAGGATGGVPNVAGSGGFFAGGSGTEEPPAPGASGGSGGAPLDASVDPSGDAAPDASGGVGGCVPDVPLRRRPEDDPPAVVDGRYDSLNPGWSRLARNTEWMKWSGRGYLALRWEIEYGSRAGMINLPAVMAAGAFFRVGGGGGYHLDDPQPGTTGTYMGNPEQGISYMAPGVETPWHIEFYYLDGDVIVTLQETDGLHNIEFQTQPYSALITPGSGVYAPGVVCDRE